MLRGLSHEKSHFIKLFTDLEKIREESSLVGLSVLLLLFKTCLMFLSSMTPDYLVTSKYSPLSLRLWML